MMKPGTVRTVPEIMTFRAPCRANDLASQGAHSPIDT